MKKRPPPAVSRAAARPCILSTSIGCAPRRAECRYRSEDAAVATATTAVNARIRQSNDRSSVMRSAGVDSCATRARLPHAATTRPPIAPHAARTRLSISSCRARRAPRRAKGEPHAELVPARGGARQQQVRDVDARDHQHEQHDNEDREERTRVGLAAVRWAPEREVTSRSPRTRA